jgi:dTDP-4-dehydrorhamnose 3,5-epimerase
MRLEPTTIDGVFVVHLEPVTDERGTFTRTFSAQLFTDHGLDPSVVERSLSTNRVAGTLRGMHLQSVPFGETKFIRCTRGHVFDVAVDTRPGSPTFGRWVGIDLRAGDGVGVVHSPGIAHGFVTLVDDCDLSYQISTRYEPDAATGVRWDDPDVGIDWPIQPVVMSERDRHLPTLDQVSAGVP